MIVIDSDVLIWILRENETVKTRFTEIVVETNGYVFMTPVQVAEIHAGIKEKQRVKTERFLESLNIIDVDKLIGKLAGEFIGVYGKSHNVMMADALIAAATRVNGFKIWTLNKKHYPMLEDNEFLE